jgi:hypothetical protein
MLKQDSAKDATQDIFDKILNKTRKPPSRIIALKTEFYRRFLECLKEVLGSLANVRLLSLLELFLCSTTFLHTSVRGGKGVVDQ